MIQDDKEKNIFFLNSAKEFDIISKNKIHKSLLYPLNFKTYIFLKEKNNLNVIEPSSKTDSLKKSIVNLQLIENNILSNNNFKNSFNGIEKETFLNILHVSLSSCLEFYFSIKEITEINKFYIVNNNKVEGYDDFDNIFTILASINIKHISELHNLNNNKSNILSIFFRWIYIFILKITKNKKNFWVSTDKYGFNSIIDHIKKNFKNVSIYKVSLNNLSSLKNNIKNLFFNKIVKVYDVNIISSKYYIEKDKIEKIFVDIDHSILNLIKDNLATLLKNSITNTMSKYEFSKIILKISKPQKLFFHHLRWYDNLALAYAAKYLNIPVVLISHGSTPSNSNDHVNYVLTKHANGMSFSKFATHTVSFSPISESIIKINTDYSEKIKLNFLQIKNKNFNTKKLNNDKITLLHAGTYKHYSPRIWIYESVYEYINGLKALINLVKNYENVLLIIRVRGDLYSSQEEIINQLPVYKNIKFEIRGNFYDDLQKSDLLITYFSTTAEEAISIKKPVLLYGGSDRFKQIENYHNIPNSKKSYPIYQANIKNIKNILTSFIKYHKTENINDDYKKLLWDDKFTNLKYLFEINDE